VSATHIRAVEPVLARRVVHFYVECVLERERTERQVRWDREDLTAPPGDFSLDIRAEPEVEGAFTV